jgi:hypothetical protein
MTTESTITTITNQTLSRLQQLTIPTNNYSNNNNNTTTQQRQQQQPSLSTCHPWSVQDFLQRESTFSQNNHAWWFGKLPIISSKVLAAKGFICIGFNTIQCPICLRKFIMESYQNEEVEKQHSKQFLTSLQHSSTCPWDDNAFDLFEYELDLKRQQQQQLANANNNQQDIDPDAVLQLVRSTLDRALGV